ncbi:beta/gamma crystallin-related protein [Okeania sp. SIO1F9]|uniref:beta/gamma crystallin-related protein n=1 Tax=Okeania sp. SIO1F9 TaxID=2607813 RepID=UPI00144CD8C9|nr:beta/gamma crystallin-related protein [Okeania sp. SIO1F9]NET76247.1 beta/gamma crystallin family protein [Okeania sp. SIO1F9]
MAKLKHIIGEILSDISQARVISDNYSRDLRPLYKEDPFLKLLSVPRTDIKEATIDLKFAILCNQNDPIPTSKVAIYQHENYEGACQELSEGSYDTASLENDQLSSLKVPKGIKVTLYEHEGFQGRAKTFTKDTPWVGDDFNDITSSIKVEKLLMKDLEEINVEVVTRELTSLPETALSSISLKLDLTNF